ncbi:MAG: hypothetical protein HYV32_05305 [Candidatus Kerfeldbacteria bacterium]|nr:hypothetical protein [Candidatus Kerfeldbacteria bacterium]
MLNTALIPLQIPTGWDVMKNQFYNVDFTVDPTHPYLFDDCLLILLLKHQVATDIASFSVDVGWYPQNDPQGYYKVQALYNYHDRDYADGIVEFKSRDRFEIQRKIDEWLPILLDCFSYRLSYEETVKRLISD